MASNTWKVFISELESKAPTLLHLLTTLVSFNDRRNVSKVGTSHYPSICTAVAVLLKERNREMCGLQSLVSALLYSCHSEKQASTALNYCNSWIRDMRVSSVLTGEIHNYNGY